MITPAITATAKSCQTVMAETAINTMASDNGILLRILKLLQAKVPMTTINMTPTNAAIGICSINGAPKRTKQVVLWRQQLQINALVHLNSH